MSDRISIPSCHPSPWWHLSGPEVDRIKALARNPVPVPRSYYDSEDRDHDRPRRPKLDIRDGVCLISVVGPIYSRPTPFNEMLAWAFGAVCIEWIDQQVQEAIDSPDVKSILMVWDSPGGESSKIAETAEKIRAASLVKPIASYVPAQCCSAAYWLAAATGEITAHPSALVGSIGTVLIVIDDRPHQQEIGILELEFVSVQSPDKHPDPQTDRGKLLYQEVADGLTDVFLSAVAGFRNVDSAAVESDFGRGWVVGAAEAKKVGMIDRVGSRAEVLAKMAGPNRGKLAMSRPALQPAASGPQLVRSSALPRGGDPWIGSAGSLVPSRTIPSRS